MSVTKTGEATAKVGRVLVTDEGQSHAYRTEVPNVIFSFKLSHAAFRLYCYFKKVAGDGQQCWQSLNTLSMNCQLRRASVVDCRNELEGHGLIRVERVNWKGVFRTQIAIVNIWGMNLHTKGKGMAALHTTASSSTDGTTSDGGTNGTHPAVSEPQQSTGELLANLIVSAGQGEADEKRYERATQVVRLGYSGGTNGLLEEEPEEEEPSKQKEEKKERPRNPHADAFNAAFEKMFGEKYRWQSGDFVQLANLLKHGAVSPERLAEVADTCWRQKFPSKQFYTLRGLCAGWNAAIAIANRGGRLLTDADHARGF